MSVLSPQSCECAMTHQLRGSSYILSWKLRRETVRTLSSRFLNISRLCGKFKIQLSLKVRIFAFILLNLCI